MVRALHIGILSNPEEAAATLRSLLEEEVSTIF
jgi:hypothetical protein